MPYSGAFVMACRSLSSRPRNSGEAAPSCGGLGLRLGLRARLWRVATETDARGLILEAADFQALREMARPGLEPRTPRFSGSRGSPASATKHVHIAILAPGEVVRHAFGWAWFRAGLGLCERLEVSMNRQARVAMPRSSR